MDLKKLVIKWLVGYAAKKILKGGNMKAGIKTTEFWLTIASTALSIWFSAQGFIPADLAIKIITIAVAAYTIARAVAKLTPSKVDDDFITKLDEILKKYSGEVKP